MKVKISACNEDIPSSCAVRRSRRVSCPALAPIRSALAWSVAQRLAFFRKRLMLSVGGFWGVLLLHVSFGDQRMCVTFVTAI